MENLMIGYDLGSRYSRISWYNEKTDEPESVAVLGREQILKIPTQLCLKSDGTWAAGTAAKEAAEAGQGILITDFLENYSNEPEMIVDGKQFEKKELLIRYIAGTLELLRQYKADYAITYMTITMEDVDRDLITDLLEGAPEWHVPSDCLRVQSHAASFENFVMSQKKELWQQDVGLFEYDEDGMKYYHLSIQQRRQPVFVTCQMIPLQMYMTGQMMDALSPDELDATFLDVLKQVLTQKMISTIFLTGKGFERDWMNQSKKRLCIPGRRVFIEDNIFAGGACYSGAIDVKGQTFRHFVALNDDIIPYDLYVRGSHMKEAQKKDLVRGGESWYRVNTCETVILDGTDTVTIHVRDLFGNTEKVIPLKLEGLPERPDRTLTIEVNVTFESSDICCFKMTDKGFGGLFPPSGRVWNKRINVAAYEGDQYYKETGRLIFCTARNNLTPFYFNISHSRIYSIEELCYYIYNNIYTIGQETFEEDLFYWLEKAVGEPALAKGLRGLKKSGASLKSLVIYLMSWADYYSNSEYQQLGMTIDDIERQNPLETRKVKADTLVGYCRYMEAVAEYTAIASQLEFPENSKMTRKFHGDVYHNMACAYMRLMNFGAAAMNFKMAYDVGKNPESLKCYLWTLKLKGSEGEFFDAADQYHLDSAYIEQILDAYDEAEAGMVMGQRPDDDEAVKVIRRLKEAYRS